MSMSLTRGVCICGIDGVSGASSSSSISSMSSSASSKSASLASSSSIFLSKKGEASFCGATDFLEKIRTRPPPKLNQSYCFILREICFHTPTWSRTFHPPPLWEKMRNASDPWTSSFASRYRCSDSRTAGRPLLRTRWVCRTRSP